MHAAEFGRKELHLKRAALSEQTTFNHQKPTPVRHQLIDGISRSLPIKLAPRKNLPIEAKRLDTSPSSSPRMPSATTPRSGLGFQPISLRKSNCAVSTAEAHDVFQNQEKSNQYFFVEKKLTEQYSNAIKISTTQKRERSHTNLQSPCSKRPHMPSPRPITIAVVNSSGRQAASFIRVASAVGYHVRAQLRNLDGIVAQEISGLHNVTCLIGDLYVSPPSPITPTETNHVNHTSKVNMRLINQLFSGADLAFINTTFYGDELEIGKALADAAKAANIRHYIYSSMPDYAAINGSWPSLPLWSPKHKVEEYIRNIGLPATFVYTGIYNNNFTSLPYPLFQMEGPLADGSFEWQAPFHPDAKLPWLDAEHDVGPAVLQLVKDGVRKWGGHSIALAFERLTPIEACEAFSRGINRPVRYVHGPIEIKVKIPEGYQDQLDAISKLYPLDLEDPEKQPPYFGDVRMEESCPEEAWRLWEGPRSLEEYAREVFPLEEEANGMGWMYGDGIGDGGESVFSEDFSEVGGRLEGLELKTPARDQEEWLA